MRINVGDFNGKDIRMNLIPENAAEEFQLRAIRDDCTRLGAKSNIDHNLYSGGWEYQVVLEKGGMIT